MEDLVNDIEIGRQHPSFSGGLDNTTTKIINKINPGDQIIQDQNRQRNHSQPLIALLFLLTS